MSVRVRIKFCGDLHYSLGHVTRVFEDGRIEVRFDGWIDGTGQPMMFESRPDALAGHVQDFEPDQVEFESVVDALARLA